MTTGARLRDGRGVFVGREPELEAVADALRSAGDGRPQVVVVQGEAGIGKTAFLGQCRARATGFVVLEASGEETESHLELGVVAQLIAACPPDVAPREPRSLAPGAPAVAPFAAGADLLALLGAVQDAGPVLVMLDDAHWIDTASAGALLFALRRLHADRVCTLIAARPTAPAGDAATIGWRRFLDDPDRARRITLAGLDDREVRALASALLQAPLSSGAAERLRAHTDGHPLYVGALVAELPARSLTFGDGPLPAPHSFAATVLTRLATLGPEAQELIAAAAVAGPRCPITLAAATAGLDEPLDALDEALDAGVLVLVAGHMPAEVGFVHPLTRAAVYDDLSLGRRRALHLTLARLTVGATSLAHRVAASPGEDDELAGELAAWGRTEIAQGSLAAGVDHLLLASRVAAERALGERALLEAVEALGLSGDVGRALGLRDAVVACADSARRSFALGCMTASTGKPDVAIGELLSVTERPDLADDPDLVPRLTSALGIICAFAGQGSDARHWAQRALEDPTAPPTAHWTARQALAFGLAWCGRGPEAVASLHGLPTSRVAPEPSEVELVATRGSLRVQVGDLRGAVDDLSAVIGWSQGGLALRSLPNAYSALAEAEYRLGRWQDAFAHADLAISLARDSDQVWELATASAVAALLHAGRGEWAQATAHIETGEWATQLAPLPQALFYTGLARANLAWVRGEETALLDGLEAMWNRLPPATIEPLRRRTWELETDALLRSGRAAEAADVLERIGAARAQTADEVERLGWCRLRGVLAHAEGDAARARDAFDQGQETASGVSLPFAQGQLELAHGVFLRRSGRRGAAAARLRSARACFESLSARPFIERCDAELSAAGVRVGSTAATDLGLSPRETAVAALVAAGKSNREAGAELYLSTKAIEYHLGNIFAKLGIRSRHELASRLAAEVSGG